MGSGRGRKPQLHANSSGAAAAEALGGSPVEKSRELTIKMESHSEMSEVGQWTVEK